MVLSIWTVFLVLGKSCSVYFLDLFDSCKVNALSVIYPACGVAHGHYFCTHLLCLLCSIDGNISRTGHSDGLACDVLTIHLQHFLCQVQKTISCSLCSYKGSAVCQAFSCQDAFVQSADALVLSEHVSDLSCACSDVTGRNVCVSADIFA